MRFLFLLSLSSALLACDAVPVELDGGTPTFDAYVPLLPPRDAGPALCPAQGALDAQRPFSNLDLCADGIVPMGFGLRWERSAQRLARLGLTLGYGADHTPDGCPPSALSRGATLAIEASGGAVTDAPDPAVAFFDYQVVGARTDGTGTADAGTSRMRFARGSATIDLVDGAIEGTGASLVDLGLAGLADATDVALVIEGFALTTDVPQSSLYPGDWDPVRGYASRGLGIAIESSTRTGDALTVRVSARFEPGSLDRPDWEPGHDRAILIARTRVIVRVLAIATDAPPVRETISYTVAAAQADPLENREPCHALAAQTALTITGTPALDRAVVGLTRFDLALWPDLPRVGDHLREVSMRILDLSYDPATGRATMQVDGYASNAGPFPRRGVDLRVEAEVTLAQWSGGGEIASHTLVAPAPVGRSELGLPLR